jgi:hypothetical protein
MRTHDSSRSSRAQLDGYVVAALREVVTDRSAD